MTRDEILAMEPGRELDAFVSEGVFGIDATRRHWFKGDKRHYDFMDENHVIIPAYSSDISAAWEVVGAMGLKGKTVKLEQWPNGNYNVAFMANYEGKVANSLSAPEAITKAALLAVMDA